jgi:hypothetical protein
MAISRSRSRLPKPRTDTYTGLLAVSLIGMIVGCIFLYRDYDTYKGKPPNPARTTSAAGGL